MDEASRMARANAVSSIADDATIRPMRSSSGRLYHVVPDSYDGGDLRSLYEQLGDDAYEEFARRWPEAGDLGQVHANRVFLYDDIADAQSHADSFGGRVLEIDPAGLDVRFDDLEIPYGRQRGFPYVERKIPRGSITSK